MDIKSTEYHENGKVKKEVYDEGVILGYDERGNNIHYKDPDGYETWREYNERGNMIHSKDSDGIEWWREYDDRGNVIHYKDSNGEESWSGYDKNNKCIYFKINDKVLLDKRKNITKKLFISQPMNGLSDEEIKTQREKYRIEAEEKVGEPLELIDSFIEEEVTERNIPLSYLGRSIISLANADVVYFGKGWQDQRGCKIEHICAVDYGIETILFAEFDAHKTSIGKRIDAGFWD